MPLFSLSVILFRSFKVCFSDLYFVLLSSIPWYGSLKVALFKHLLIEGYEGCFQFGTITNKANMSIYVQVLPKLNPPLFFFWDKCSTAQIAESYGKHMFSFVRNYHMLFQSGCTIFHSYQQHMHGTTSWHTCQHLVLHFYFSSLTGFQ